MLSMTGFGSGSFSLKGIKYTVEIKSVNHKYFDVCFKMPESLICYQEKIKKIIKNKVMRGYLDVAVFIEYNLSNKEILIDNKLARAYLKSLKNLQQDLKLKGDITLNLLLGFPEIIKIKSLSKVSWLGLKNALLRAIENLLNMKEKEGNRIKRDIDGRVRKLKDIIDDIIKINTKSIPENKKRLEEKIKERFKDVNMNEDRLYTEISLMIEKSDITEEILRLNSHLSEFCNIMRNKIVGRKLDFLIQEIMREINTLGAKCNNINISHKVVNFKEELEKIREQVQNVE